MKLPDSRFIDTDILQIVLNLGDSRVKKIAAISGPQNTTVDPRLGLCF